MVNLAFCKLDVTYLISLAIPKHNIHLFPYIPSAGRSFMLEFLGWSSKYHLGWCFPNCFGLFGHLLFGFRFPGEIVICWPEGNQRKRWWAWIMIPICWMLLVSWWIFSNNRRRLFRSRPMDHFKLFKVFDRFGRFCLLLCLCIILTWNPIDYRLKPLLLVVHQRIYWCCISSLCL